MRRGYKSLSVIIFSVAAISACAPAPKPVVIAPPPPVILPPPPPPVRPLPPGGAALSMRIPVIGVDGVRVTPNRGLSRDDSIWHFRAALNVAALNCQGPVWGQIAQSYNKLIVTHKVQLSKSSKAVDREYVARYKGQNGLRVRDTMLTDLYNYFALPPVRAEYCDAALRKVNEAITVPLDAFPEYAVGGLKDIDDIFIRFFDAYVQYERDLAEWNMKYAPQPVFVPLPTQPAPVQPTTAPPIMQPPVTKASTPAPG